MAFRFCGWFSLLSLCCLNKTGAHVKKITTGRAEAIKELEGIFIPLLGKCKPCGCFLKKKSLKVIAFLSKVEKPETSHPGLMTDTVAYPPSDPAAFSTKRNRPELKQGEVDLSRTEPFFSFPCVWSSTTSLLGCSLALLVVTGISVTEIQQRGRIWETITHPQIERGSQGTTYIWLCVFTAAAVGAGNLWTFSVVLSWVTLCIFAVSVLPAISVLSWGGHRSSPVLLLSSQSNKLFMDFQLQLFENTVRSTMILK